MSGPKPGKNSAATSIKTAMAFPIAPCRVIENRMASYFTRGSGHDADAKLFRGRA